MKHSNKIRALAGLIVWGTLAVTPLRPLLEARLPTHLLQIVLLLLAGALLGSALRRSPWGESVSSWNLVGLPGALLAVFTVLFWILPSSVDAAVQEPRWEAAKIVCLVLLGGVPLGLSWSPLRTPGQAFLSANAAAMSGSMGALYLALPQRLCASYALADQRLLGMLLLPVAAFLALATVLRLVLAAGPKTNGDGPPIKDSGV